MKLESEPHRKIFKSLLCVTVQELKTWVQVLALLLIGSHLVLLSLSSLCVKQDQTILPVSQNCHSEMD